ncbi:fumarylacetoacetate hydrolase family protein [Arthrobacter sp. NPDC058097]|uniref:fumarylacetoacetate hydrolase family protein n=1 Tax=Arthrobacter sp. NPDC058097 TaxID=3346340 RepID=UPI0036D78AF7
MRIVGVRFSHTGPVFAGRLEDNGDQASVQPLTDLQTFWSDPFWWVSFGDDSTTPAERPVPVRDVSIVPPVLPSARVLCVGLNYLAHAAEGSHRHEELPSHPTVFGRWSQSLTTGDTPVPVPSGENGLDWEGEIAAYIGHRQPTGRCLSRHSSDGSLRVFDIQ